MEMERLPKVKFINITGGEPFVREDLEEIVEVAFRKSPRVVILEDPFKRNTARTAGWFPSGSYPEACCNTSGCCGQGQRGCIIYMPLNEMGFDPKNYLIKRRFLSWLQRRL